MSDKVGLRDKRDSKWFWVNNVIYDLKLSCEAMALYCAIARYANNQTEKAYFSGKKFKAHHKIGHAKLEAARAELLKHKLIAETGSKTLVGALYYELCEVSHLETGGCSEAEQGGVSGQNTNHTNKTKQENHKAIDSKESHAEPSLNKSVSKDKIKKEKSVSRETKPLNPLEFATPDEKTLITLVEAKTDQRLQYMKKSRSQIADLLTRYTIDELTRSYLHFADDVYWQERNRPFGAFVAAIEKYRTLKGKKEKEFYLTPELDGSLPKYKAG